MEINKLPEPMWADSQQHYELEDQLSTDYITRDNLQQTEYASNDASYESELSQAIANVTINNENANKATVSGTPYVEKAIAIDGGYKKAKSNALPLSIEHGSDVQSKLDSQPSVSVSDDSITSSTIKEEYYDPKEPSNLAIKQVVNKQTADIPERVFMNCLIKHTVIALAIIVPLAAFSAYAAPSMNMATAVSATDIIYDSAATTPVTVASVDLDQYTGTWYEIGRLPMYFQRNCARDVTATYTIKTDDSGIAVTNKCMDKDGSGIVAEGIAKPGDDTGSKLKVTFLPSWLRWLSVGRADYWVLARDADYKTALVGTPDNEYLWLLARTPNITQQTYAKYRQIAQQQGYDLKAFNLTPQSGQTVKLIP